ncbi:flagellar basal body rod protein FlgC [Borrelia turicatae]|uniref:Flagellar basal-body rod protein FlgC n=1 Tax=Borrelia turicatae (strain 91E135) TaxID=314724 RepID=A0ABF7PVB7_BORT9|nr:flagellar basal body rod protein FlgC [Borrelia turicatae]AAX17631.1 flagellar basal-body rod protein FlgC [Borrelia turicatae 91E135]UPA13153.1 flagellar basal body rod protein FlgC [Borrelia turicatae 91E135]
MGLFSSINTAATGLTAQRLRLDVIANNIANVETTRTSEGGSYRRQRIVFSPRVVSPYWKGPFVPDYLDNGIGQGVRVAGIERDKSPLKLKYDPTHPDAIKSGERKGYVEFPNVNAVEEMVDMISASRAYEANSTVINSSKAIFRSALSILQN